MATYILTYEEDQSLGGMGFRIEGSTLDSNEYNMATDGLLIAHDILEHARIKEIGSIGDELRALGAIWFVRGQWGELRRDRTGSAYSIHENIASDVTRMGRDVIEGGCSYNNPFPRTTQPKRCGAYEDIKEIIEIARKELPEELDERNPEAEKRYLDKALIYMCAGYNNAKRRYRWLDDRFAANNLFWTITDEVNRILKWADFPGQQFKLHVNFKQCRVIAEEYYPEY